MSHIRNNGCSCVATTPVADQPRVALQVQCRLSETDRVRPGFPGFNGFPVWAHDRPVTGILLVGGRVGLVPGRSWRDRRLTSSYVSH